MIIPRIGRQVQQASAHYHHRQPGLGDRGTPATVGPVLCLVAEHGVGSSDRTTGHERLALRGIG